MATVTPRYRCPVTPEACPSSPRRGYCQNHEWEQLVPERAYLRAEPEAGPDIGPEAEPEDAVGASRAVPTAGSSGRSGQAVRDARPDRAAGSDATARRATPAAPAPAPAAPAAPVLALVVSGALIPVRSAGLGPTRLGRDAPDCAHVPGLAALDQISRNHAELYWHEGRLYIADTGSSNGTHVDAARITRPTQLWPGVHRLRLAQPPDAVDVTLVELDEYGAPR